MAEGSFNIAAVIKRLGLKRVNRLDFVEAIQPVVSVGNAEQHAPWLQPAEAFFGGSEPTSATRRGTMQVRSLGLGGIFVVEMRFHFQATLNGSAFRIDLDGVDPIAADPLLNPRAGENLNPDDPVLSIVTTGLSNTTIGSGLPKIGVGQAGGEPAAFNIEFYLPHGALLTYQCRDLNVASEFFVRIRELPAADLTPLG